MTAPRKKHCPVCWRLVGRTMHDCIEAHWDTSMEPCRGGGEPYRITLARKPIHRDTRLPRQNRTAA